MCLASAASRAAPAANRLMWGQPPSAVRRAQPPAWFLSDQNKSGAQTHSASHPCLSLANALKPQNTSPPDDAPPTPTCSAPAPAKIPRSSAPRHSSLAPATQTASSGPQDLGTPDSQTNTSIPDTSDETNGESPPHPRPATTVPNTNAGPQGPACDWLEIPLEL